MQATKVTSLKGTYIRIIGFTTNGTAQKLILTRSGKHSSITTNKALSKVGINFHEFQKLIVRINHRGIKKEFTVGKFIGFHLITKDLYSQDVYLILPWGETIKFNNTKTAHKHLNIVSSKLYDIYTNRFYKCNANTATAIYNAEANETRIADANDIESLKAEREALNTVISNANKRLEEIFTLLS